MRSFYIASLLAFIAPSAFSASPVASIVAAGLCEQPKVTERYAQPQSTAGYATLGELIITKKTDVIPLQKDISFGFSWRAEGLPKNVQVMYVIDHPPITRPDGKRMESFQEPMAHESVNGVLETTDCYSLSEEHELVPGNWSITIMHDGAPLVKHTFRITR